MDPLASVTGRVKPPPSSKSSLPVSQPCSNPQDTTPRSLASAPAPWLLCQAISFRGHFCFCQGMMRHAAGDAGLGYRCCAPLAALLDMTTCSAAFSQNYLTTMSTGSAEPPCSSWSAAAGRASPGSYAGCSQGMVTSSHGAMASTIVFTVPPKVRESGNLLVMLCISLQIRQEIVRLFSL